MDHRAGWPSALAAPAVREPTAEGLCEAALEFRAVSKRYRQGAQDVVALARVDLAIGAGELVALVGPSGSGKSTLLHLAGGLDEPESGTVLVGGTDVGALRTGARARLRRRHIGFVFQFFQLIPSLSVQENVELPLMLGGESDSAAVAAALLGRVGLSARARHHPHELSGGEMQRVAIARALVARPALILADEPTGNLDSVTGEAVLDLLTSEVRECGATLLLVTHDERAAARADRVLSLRDGTLSGT